MSGKIEIMHALCEGLNSLAVDGGKNDTVWTTVVKTELCKIGRRFDYSVYAKADEVDEAHRTGGEWLYDVTWLEYECDGRRSWPAMALIDAPLVAECEWGNFEEIVYDFEKLLLTRTRVRLMIFDSEREGGSKETAEQLAGKVREFNGFRAEDTWLLAAWENDSWSFKYFTIEMNTAVPFLPTAGT